MEVSQEVPPLRTTWVSDWPKHRPTTVTLMAPVNGPLVRTKLDTTGGDSYVKTLDMEALYLKMVTAMPWAMSHDDAPWFLAMTEVSETHAVVCSPVRPRRAPGERLRTLKFTPMMVKVGPPPDTGPLTRTRELKWCTS